VPDDAFALLLAKARAEGRQFTDAEMSCLENQTRMKQLKDLASAGRVISASVSDVLTFSDSIDVSAESQEGDDSPRRLRLTSQDAQTQRRLDNLDSLLGLTNWWADRLNHRIKARVRTIRQAACSARP
jgi:hypothetical protein